MTTIVIAWESNRISTRHMRRTNCPYIEAAVWLLDGTPEDVKKAESYAKAEDAKEDGTSRHTVFTFEDEAQPLERARALMLKEEGCSQ